MSQTVIGVFDSATEAQQAVQQLVSNGFMRDNIDISNQNTTDTDASVTRENTDDDQESGIGKFFRSLFGSDDDDSSKYSEVARRGSVVTVHAQSEDEAERAADLLDEYGAVDVDERATQYGYTGKTDSMGTRTDSMDTTSVPLENQTRDFSMDDAKTSAQVIEENLQIDKKMVQTGGARLRSRIVERPVEESIRLREEHVRVDRKPVDRPATDADFTSFKEGEIELTEQAEVPVVSKQARVVEEVSLGKEVNEREETIRDTVRSAEVDVENLGTTTDADELRRRSMNQNNPTNQ
ncbi:MAG: YsnF/AvaK domain-containing protein [Cytophagaceae bacterium]|nr:YsnF/AvaK domain-containing protein [Cytophagaceae bacterium]